MTPRKLYELYHAEIITSDEAIKLISNEYAQIAFDKQFNKILAWTDKAIQTVEEWEKNMVRKDTTDPGPMTTK